MRTLILLAGALLTLSACDDSPPVDNSPVPSETVCSEAEGSNCVQPDSDLPPQDQNAIVEGENHE